MGGGGKQTLWKNGAGLTEGVAAGDGAQPPPSLQRNTHNKTTLT